MKLIAVFLFGALCGAVLVWWLIPARYNHVYQTTRPLTLHVLTLPSQRVPDQAHLSCVLPEGTPLLADVELTRTPDLGWWGFAPVLFDDMWQAQDLGVVPWNQPDELWKHITLRAAGHAEVTEVSPGGEGAA